MKVGPGVAVGRADLGAAHPVRRRGPQRLLLLARAAGCRPVVGCGATCSSAGSSSARCRSRCSRCPRPGSARRWPASATPPPRSRPCSPPWRSCRASGPPVGGSSPWASGSSASSRSCSRGPPPTGPTSSASRWRWPAGRATASGGPTTGASSAASTSAGSRSRRRPCSPALVLMVPVVLGWASLQPEGLAAIWSYDAPDAGTWLWLPLVCVLVLGLVGTGFAYILQFDVVRGAGPMIGSTITYLIPVVSVRARRARAGRAPRPLAGRRLRHRARGGLRHQPRPRAPEAVVSREHEEAVDAPR